MARKSALKIIAFIGIGIFAILIFFQDHIMVYLIEPIGGIFEMIITFLPGICWMGAIIFLVGGLINSKRRASCLILAGLCFFFGLTLSNPGGFQGIADYFGSWFGQRPTPKGYH